MPNNNQKQKYMMGLGGTTGGVGMLNLDPINWGAINVKQNKPRLPGLGGDPMPSNSATVPSPAPNPAQTSPAKQQFISNLSNLTSPQQNAPYVNPNAAFNNNVGANAPQGTPVQTPQAPAVNPRQQYIDQNRTLFDSYVQSLQPSEELTTARKRLSDFDIQMMKDEDRALNMGETLGFARGEAERTNRANAIERMARASELEALTGDYNARVGAARERFNFEQGLLGDMPDEVAAQATPEGFSLGEGQSRYEYDPTTGQYKQIAFNPKTYAPSTTGLGTTPSLGGGQIVDAAGRPIKLTATQADSITGFDNTLGAAKNALNLLAEGVSTGPVAGRTLQAAKFLGGGNEKQIQLEQVLAKLKADFMKAISGAAVSESEAQRLAAFLPEITDQENVIRIKLNTLISESQRTKDNLLKTLGASGSTFNDVASEDASYAEYLRAIGQ